MTPRPVQASKSRPLSAIFIGSAGSTPPALPDLPEPPSPSTSSNASGLPSPPATNSTGSGSVGEGSITAGSLRHRTSSSKSSSEMSGGGGERSYGYNKKRSSVLEDEDDPDDNENDEDHTARLSDDRRRSFPKTTDNQTALQRVKNLTQRNRMVLDKLSSISRGSPVPSNHSRSPMSPPTAGSSSSSSVTSSSHLSSLQPRPQSVSSGSVNSRRRETQLSGSETERESVHQSNQSTSSDGRPTTPPPPPSAFPDIRAPASVRQRRISAPASPAKNGRANRERDRGPSPGRKRVSTAFSVDEGYGHYRSDDEDVSMAALAAVASSRRDPGSSGKKGRPSLPREFRNRKDSDEKLPPEPATPHRHPTRNELGRASPSPRKNRVVASDPPASPRRFGQSRYSTVRELTRNHQTRWMSEDLSSPSRENPDQPLYSIMGRSQGHRSGSSEGLLGTAGGRSLLGEGLRAAGLTKRRDEDVFNSPNGEPHDVFPRRTHSTGNSSVIAGGGDGSPEQSRESRSIRIDEGVGPPRDPKTPLNGSYRFTDRRPQSGLAARPGTSMAALHHDTHDMAPPRTAPPALRSYRSTYALPSRVAEDLRQEASHERATSSPFGTLRSSTAQGGARDNNAEHRRLMLDSLSMFESQLSRLPPMGQTSTTTIPEVFQSAQHLVHALDKLNVMLKDGTNKALEAQIDAELADCKEGVDLMDLWREVGSDHRENLRVSDEVVRNMTGFLLGVGKILREATSYGGQQHLRTMSLDEEVIRRGTPEVQAAGSRDSDGRRSRDSRRSWEPGRETARLLTRLSSLERNGNGDGARSRPGSAMQRSSTTSSSEGRSASETANDGTPATLRQSAPVLAPSSAARRLYAPRDRGSELSGPLVTSLSQDDFSGDYEPSPTPISRQAHVALPDRRAFPPIAVPPSLSTLPSESLLTRSNTIATDKSSRRKISSSSIVTVRAEPSPFIPTIKPSNPTTAVTAHTVSASPEADRTPFPMLRSESGSSARTNGVTFSRPTTISVSTALSGLQQQHARGARSRTVSNASSIADNHSAVPAPPLALQSSTSGSESERESRWKTLSGRPRASLDSNRSSESPIDAGDRSLASTVSYSAARKERRRTITEVFPR
ncbi:hypothetical protein C8Q78DRAFT_974695 [Trametes maxima]|nr:hypothetical protein C8Q78DRAFT_974695 [Trametes maxima]